MKLKHLRFILKYIYASLMKKRFNIVIILLWISISGTLFAKTDIEIVKQRVLAEILEATVDDVEVAHLIQSITTNGSWPDVNYEDLSRTGFENRFHLISIISS